MGWSLSIGRLFGIPVKVHATLLILVAVFGFMAADQAGLRGLLLIVLLFGSVLVHELGHALVARRFGVRTREIVLLPIGGAAILSEEPKHPTHELLIALAGPAASFALAGVAFVVGLVTPLQALADLCVVNLMLGLFNLVPAFPLDGGRVLRAGLSRWMGRLRATRMAARFGRMLALAAIVFGVYDGEVVLAIVGAFVMFAATAEERSAIIHAFIGQRRVSDLMQAAPRVFGVSATVDEVREVLDANAGVGAVPVSFGERVMGVLHREDVDRLTGDRALGDAVDRNFVTATTDAPLIELLTQMSEARSRVAVVMADDVVAGLVTVDRVLEELRAARHSEF